MEEICNIVVAIINNIPWFVIAYIAHTVFDNKPRKVQMHYKEFSLECDR